MAERKRRSPVPKIRTPKVPDKKTGKVIRDEIIYSGPSTSTPFLGAVAANEIVNILDLSHYAEGWTKIETTITHVTGFINSMSII